jgi:hypothetical protein
VQSDEDEALLVAQSRDRCDSFSQDKRSQHGNSYQEALYGAAQDTE